MQVYKLYILITMKKAHQIFIKLFVGSLSLVIVIITAWLILYYWNFGRDDFKLGVNFSQSYAEYLGLDYRQTYLAILDELKVKNIRLAAQWNQIEPKEGKYLFEELDWQIEEAEKKGVQVILVLGRRTPHWPECHDPDWLKEKSATMVQEKQFKLMERVINRYKTSSAVVMWQVENEPLLDIFGDCPPSDLAGLRKEVALVKTLDANRPILITDSGELGLWLAASRTGDLFGTTLYRVTYNPTLGYAYYHLPPLFYRLKAWLVGIKAEKALVAELQAEPWSPDGLNETPLAEQLKSMDAHRLKAHVSYAQRTGFSGAYLWGAEWWFWLKEKKQNNDLWEAAADIFEN